jgi:hypothetical protein
VIGTTFLYIDYGPSPYIGRELRYSLATLLAEVPAARVVVYTDKPRAYETLPVTPRPLGADLARWSRDGAYNHRVKPSALADALRAQGGLCVLIDTDSWIEPGFAATLARAVATGPAMDVFEKLDPYPQAAGFTAELPHSGRYAYEGARSQMCNSGLVAVEASRDGAAVEDALALIDAFFAAGLRLFNVEQLALTETLRRLGCGIGEMRPAFQHYCRRSLKRYMHWRIDAWMRRAPEFTPTRPCIAHPRNAVRAFNWVNRVGGWYA